MTPEPRHGTVPCELCGLEVQRDGWLLRTAGRLHRFCYPGCRQAYVISRAVHDAEFPSPGVETGRDAEA